MTNPSNRYDILTDINLKLIFDRNNWSSYWYFVNENGDQLHAEVDILIEPKELANYMKYDCRLIEIDGEICKLNKKGLSVLEQGGWLNYLDQENKRHEKRKQEELLRQEKQDKILDFDIRLKEFEVGLGLKFKKWAFIILIINLLITILTVVLSHHFSSIPEKEEELSSKTNTLENNDAIEHNEEILIDSIKSKSQVEQ